MTRVPDARALGERYCPNTGVPVRLGRVWPPRLIIHDVCTKGAGVRSEAIASVWVRHSVRGPVEVTVRPGPEPASDPQGRPLPGVSIGRSARVLDNRETWVLIPLTIQWTPELQRRLQALPWVRKSVRIDLRQGDMTRTFTWYAYLTPDAPELPRPTSLYDDHPHYRWVDAQGSTVENEEISNAWIELPAPMSSPDLPPACWIQHYRAVEGEPSPSTVDILPIFPLEPAIRMGTEVVGWNGALGAHDRRPMLLPLAVSNRRANGQWLAALDYWDTPLDAPSNLIRQGDATVLEAPTRCVWPRILLSERHVLELYQLRDVGRDACLVKRNIRFRMPEDAEPIQITEAEIRVGTTVVGHWMQEPMELFAGREWSLVCSIDQHALARLTGNTFKLSVWFKGRPTRGIVGRDRWFRTENELISRLHRPTRSSTEERDPWVCIDLGTEGTCAAVAFLDGYAPKVQTVSFGEGPIFPSRVFISAGEGGAWALTDQPTDEALYTSGIKLGMRFGDGAHPGCPDHVSATEVARFFVKRFLLELRERAAWFPLEHASVLVSFPPRLACIPKFVTALRDVFSDVIPEVLWTGGQQNRLSFREEAFLVAMPSLYKDMEHGPIGPERPRYYWVMDFGGGTTDVCGFLLSSDEYGEEHTISHFSYPQRFPHHLSGNDVTRAFYAALRRHLAELGVVSTTRDGGRRFVFPEDPFPTTRIDSTTLINQTALRELADLLKCVPMSAQRNMTVRELAKTLRSTTIISDSQVRTTLVALLGDEAQALGSRSVHRVHLDVLDPAGQHEVLLARPLTKRAPVYGRRLRRDTATVACTSCSEPHELPIWVFRSSKTFRFRCQACGQTQTVTDVAAGVASPLIEDGRPTILASEPGATRPEGQSLTVRQGTQIYRVPDWDTLVRWVRERRVGPEDQVSENGMTWEVLSERPELLGVLPGFELEGGGVLLAEEDTRPADVPSGWLDAPALADDIEKFLVACNVALSDSLSRLPDEGAGVEVVVLLAGRASQFSAITEGVKRMMPGRVIHLNNDWVQQTYGQSGTIDSTSGLKTLTVNGGGLYALNQTNTDTSPLVLSFNTHVMECHTFVRPPGGPANWLTRHLDLRPGHFAPVVTGVDTDTQDPAPLDVGTPLAGPMELLIEGLPQDREQDAYVVVATGGTERVDGHRARIGAQTRLRTSQDGFELVGLEPEGNAHFQSLLPRLDLLGQEER